MINFSSREDVLPSILILLSIAMLAGTLAFRLIVPIPTSRALTHAHVLANRVLLSQFTTAKQRAVTAGAAIEPRLWLGNSDVVSANVLALVTNAARSQALTLAAFRPQRAQALDGIAEIPYSVQVTGTYSGIRGLMNTLDSDNSKVVLRSVQIASSEEAGGAVTASIGLSVFIPSDPDVIAASSSTHGRGGKHA